MTWSRLSNPQSEPSSVESGKTSLSTLRLQKCYKTWKHPSIKRIQIGKKTTYFWWTTAQYIRRKKIKGCFEINRWDTSTVGSPSATPYLWRWPSAASRRPTSDKCWRWGHDGACSLSQGRESLRRSGRRLRYRHQGIHQVFVALDTLKSQAWPWLSCWWIVRCFT